MCYIIAPAQIITFLLYFHECSQSKFPISVPWQRVICSRHMTVCYNNNIIIGRWRRWGSLRGRENWTETWRVVTFPFSPDTIVTELLDPQATSLPSPNQLKRRVLIKHKKIEVNDKVGKSGTLVKHSSSSSSFHKTSSSGSIQVDDDVDTFMSDLSNQRKNGYLYMQDPIDKVRS